jgi:hypothetical protein
MDPLTLASDPLPGPIVLLFSLAWIAQPPRRRDRLIALLDNIGSEAWFVDRA